MEKNYAETEGRGTLKLALRALTEVVEGSSKNIEVAVVEKEGLLRFLTGQQQRWGQGGGQDRVLRRCGWEGLLCFLYGSAAAVSRGWGGACARQQRCGGVVGRETHGLPRLLTG